LKTQADTDWENRKLCSDESCIGVIGPDGRCKECGKRFEGEHHEQGPCEIVENDEPTPESIEDADDAPEPEADSDDDWENRTLCRDESCIGVIGPDGRCKECGKLFKG
jgi:hypothetical protein